MKISFFKTGKPRDFSYRPMFYNERKEELEKIKKSVEAESGDDASERIRVRLERSWRDRHDRRRHKATSNLRLLVYLAAIILAIYFMFFAKIF